MFLYKFLKAAIVSSAILALPIVAQADIYTDPVYGFTLDIPSDWGVEAQDDGPDRILRLSPQIPNTYVEVRAVHLKQGTSASDLRRLYANTLSSEAELVLAQPMTFAGLEGETVAWKMRAGNADYVLGGFFAVDGPVGYIMLAQDLASELQGHQQQYDAVFATLVPGTRVTTYLGGGAINQAQRPPAQQTQASLPTGAPNSGVAEEHPELGFILYRPEDWISQQPQTYSLMMGPKDVAPASRPTVSVQVVAGTSYEDLGAVAADMKSQLKGSKNLRFYQDGEHALANLTEADGTLLAGYSFGAAFRENGADHRQLFFLYERQVPNVYYLIFFNGPEDQLLDYQLEMMRILGAMRMVPFPQ